MSYIVKTYWKYLKRNYYNSYTTQKKIRNLPLDEIKKIQWNRLKELMQTVYNFSDFYHESFVSSNLKPQDIKSYQDFQKLPIINKKILKKNYDKIKTKESNEKDYIISYTSGSTGEPFCFLLDKKREVPSTFAAFLLNKENIGINPFSKINTLMIKAEPINEIKNLFQTTNRKNFDRIKQYFSSETFGIKSLNIKKENAEIIYSIITKHNIKALYGYSSNIFYLAKLFKMNNIEVQLKYVILMAEGILKQQKNFISETFSCPVYMDYGASECMRMGFESDKCNSYHMDIYNYFFEYLDNDGKPCHNGENANIIVTNLNNYIFPLIRYAIGDQCIISDEKCSCGLNYPKVSQIIGRASDVIKTPLNDEISLSNFAVFFEYLHEYIIQYQLIIDEKAKEIIIKIIPTDNYKPEISKKINEKILELMNYSMSVKIEIVKKIPFEKNGKTKTLIFK